MQVWQLSWFLIGDFFPCTFLLSSILFVFYDQVGLYSHVLISQQSPFNALSKL